MKQIQIVLLCVGVLLAASCKQDDGEGSGVINNNEPVFYFRGTLGTAFQNVEAGRDNINAIAPIPFSVHRPGIVDTGFKADESAFKTSAILERNGNGPVYSLMLFFCLPTADSLRTGMYPVAVYNPALTNVYSQGKAALRIVSQQNNSDYVSYSQLNTDLTGQFVEVTKIEPYNFSGVTGKKVSYRLNLKLFNFRQPGSVFIDSKTLTGEGAALFYQ